MTGTNTSYCRKCRKIVEVLGFERDDPVLSCGHVKTRGRENAKLDALRLNIAKEDLLLAIMSAYITTRVDAISYCPVCDATVSVIEDGGVRICGGNLLDNPGCGCSLKPIEERLTTPPTPMKCG